MGRLLETIQEEDRRYSEIHAVIAGITIPNPASIGLHEKLGFKEAGRFPEVGYKRGQWLDVGYWELLRADRPLGLDKLPEPGEAD